MVVSPHRLAFILLLAHAGVAADVDSIRLRSGTLSGPTDTAGLPEHRRIVRPEAGDPILIKLVAPVTPGLLVALERAGAHVESFVGPNAFLARLVAPSARALEDLEGVDWIAPYHPGLRVDPELEAIRGTDSPDRVPVTLHVSADADVERIAARLHELDIEPSRAIPGHVGSDRSSRRPGRILLSLPTAQLTSVLDAVTRWPEILWVGLRPRYDWINDTSAWVGQSGLDGGHSTPVHDHGILGAGQTIGVFDTGVDVDMCYFRDTSLGLPPTHIGFGVGNPNLAQRKVTIVDFLWPADNPSDPDEWDHIGHGTHVIGSAAGDNFANPGERDTGDGMAPAAKLVVQDAGDTADACADLDPDCLFDDLYPIFEQAWLQGARIHSNSYGDVGNPPWNVYSEGSEAADAIMWDHPDLLVVIAAGNLGPSTGTVTSPSTAKNAMSVGATRRGTQAGSIWSASSRGPTLDGRIKPDVTAPGESIDSARSDFDVETFNCNRTSFSGTSMACPTVAGLAALVREYFDRGFYPSGIATPVNAFAPSAALVKATTIVSAKAMENVSPVPPSSTQGWGRVLLDDALFFPGDAERLFAADVAARFSSPANTYDVYVLDVPQATLPLRVVVTWTDYPSTPAASVNLVNDLDLEVVSPSGSVYRGNVFSGGASQTGGTRDTLNNVEVVRVVTPQVGEWTVRVIPRAIPQPAQGYALVATGASLAGELLLPPNAVNDLRVERVGSAARLVWSRPPTDTSHGPTASYTVYRSAAASTGFTVETVVTGSGPVLQWSDSDPLAPGRVFFYDVLAGNEAGVSDSPPGH